MASPYNPAGRLLMRKRSGTSHGQKNSQYKQEEVIINTNGYSPKHTQVDKKDNSMAKVKGKLNIGVL